MGDTGGGSLGCSLTTSAPCTTGLTDDSFSNAGSNLTIQTLELSSDGILRIILDPTLVASVEQAPTLHVGSRQFPFTNATSFGTTLFWENSGLDWSVGGTVQLRLTLAVELSTLTASFSPDGPVKEDWETPSRDDLWSATLRARDLTTPESAPANVGCDDSQASARCSSALSPRNFTFKGVRYTVKAISYNQRKVTADTTTFTVKTYEEKLKLTLDKTIPESLQSCLTLHVGDTKLPLADGGVAGTRLSAALSDSGSHANLDPDQW